MTEHFQLHEFNCKDGTEVPEHLRANVMELALNLEVLREALQAPIHVNSAYRTPVYNASIGGAINSQHLLAKAADITVNGYTPKQAAATIERLILAGKMTQGGLGIYPTFVHYDIRGTKARW